MPNSISRMHVSTETEPVQLVARRMRSNQRAVEGSVDKSIVEEISLSSNLQKTSHGEETTSDGAHTGKSGGLGTTSGSST